MALSQLNWTGRSSEHSLVSENHSTVCSMWLLVYVFICNTSLTSVDMWPIRAYVILQNAPQCLSDLHTYNCRKCAKIIVFFVSSILFTPSPPLPPLPHSFTPLPSPPSLLHSFTPLPSLTLSPPSGIQSLVKSSMEESLVQILSPKRRVDILRDIMAARDKGQPYVITFCGVNGVGKSTNLAKVLTYRRASSSL